MSDLPSARSPAISLRKIVSSACPTRRKVTLLPLSAVSQTRDGFTPNCGHRVTAEIGCYLPARVLPAGSGQGCPPAPRISFPTAVCILDYYHACEHLTLLAHALYGEGSALAKKRYRQWRKALLKDKIDQIISQARAELPARAQTRTLAKKQIAYFERNKARMLYQTFRQSGYFIRSD